MSLEKQKLKLNESYVLVCSVGVGNLLRAPLVYRYPTISSLLQLQRADVCQLPLCSWGFRPNLDLTMSAEVQERSGNREKSRTLLLIYINIALYATCFQIQRPLEPFLVEKLGLTNDSGGEYAKLQSFFSLMQTVGSLLAGYYTSE